MRRPADFDEYIWGAETWPFFTAVVEGDEATVRRMLAASPWLARAQYAYLECLHFAVKGSRASMVELLLQAGANPMAEGWSGRFGPEFRDDTPLGRARDREQEHIVALLEASAARALPAVPEAPKPPPPPERALEDEMMKLGHLGDVEGALHLIGKHPGIAQAALYEAVHQDHPDLVRILIEAGANPTRPWRWSCWYTVLMHCLRYPSPRYDTAQLLFEHGVSPDDRNGMGMTTLHILAAEGTPEAARWLLDRGADIHARDGQYDSTPLAWAARAGREGMVELFLERGAMTLHPDDPPWAAPAAWARRRGHAGIVAQLERV